MTPPDRCFDYLRSKSQIICRKSDNFVAKRLKITAEGWFTSTVRLWHNASTAKKWESRSRSVVSENSDSGFDEVNF